MYCDVFANLVYLLLITTLFLLLFKLIFTVPLEEIAAGTILLLFLTSIPK